MAYKINLEIGDLFTVVIRGGQHSKTMACKKKYCVERAGKPAYRGRTFIVKKITKDMICAGDFNGKQWEYQFYFQNFNLVKVKDDELKSDRAA